jgi:hypothetical protein
MRALTEAEIKQVAGGLEEYPNLSGSGGGGWSSGGGGWSGSGGWSSGGGGWSSTFTGGTITVTGNPGGSTITVTGNPSPPGSPWPSNPGSPWPSNPGGSGSGTPNPPPPPAPDNAAHEVTMGNLTRPLTAEEQANLTAYQNSVAQADAWVNALPDDAQMTLDNGQVVTGAEVKEAWANTDFVVNDVGTAYQNGTTRGESNWNNGDPVVSMNIDTIGGYNANAGGTDYLVLHEVAHLTADQRSDYAGLQTDGYIESERTTYERFANDIARGVIAYNGGTVMQNPGDGYSATNPTFAVPAPPEPTVPPGGAIP